MWGWLIPKSHLLLRCDITLLGVITQQGRGYSTKELSYSFHLRAAFRTSKLIMFCATIHTVIAYWATWIATKHRTAWHAHSLKHPPSDKETKQDYYANNYRQRIRKRNYKWYCQAYHHIDSYPHYLLREKISIASTQSYYIFVWFTT